MSEALRRLLFGRLVRGERGLPQRHGVCPAVGRDVVKIMTSLWFSLSFFQLQTADNDTEALSLRKDAPPPTLQKEPRAPLPVSAARPASRGLCSELPRRPS